MQTSIRALLLDLDGTIADTLPHLCRSFRYALEPFAKRLPSDAEIVATFGPPERVNLHQLLSNPAIASPAALAALDTAEQRFHEYYERRHDEVRPFTGIPESIALAHQRGWRVGVFTGKSRRSALFALQHFDLWRYMDCLVSGTDVTRPKPDPEGVWSAARQLEVEASQLLFIGDSPGDIVAGKTAGARTAAALWSAFDATATRKAGPDWELTSVAALRGLLEELAGPSSHG